MLTITQATIHDATGILDIYRPIIENTAISFEVEVPPIEEVQRRITAANEMHLWLVCKNEDEIIGYAYGSPHRSRYAYQWSCETSVYVHQDFRKNGVGRALYICLLKSLELQGYKTAFAGITIPNEASEKFHLSMGFKLIGEYRKVGFKNGEWHSTIWLQRPLAEYETNPAYPVPFHEIVASSDWSRVLEKASKMLK